MIKLSSIALTLAATAAIGAHNKPGGGYAAARISLPRLERQVRELGKNGPQKPNAWLALSPSGLLAYTTAPDESGGAITVVDASGSVIGRFAKRGTRMDEVRTVFGLFMTDTLVTIFTSPSQLLLFSPTGRPLGTHDLSQIPNSGTPLALIGDSLDMLVPPKYLAATRVSLVTLRGRSLVAPGTPELEKIVQPEAEKLERPRFPAYATSADWFVFAEPMHYRLQAFSAKGAPLGGPFETQVPPRHYGKNEIERQLRMFDRAAGSKRDTRGGVDAGSIRDSAAAALAAVVLPHFPAQTGVQFDGHGRLWVVRASGDSTILDVYASTRSLLTSIAIACNRENVPSGIAMAGDWLALLCDSGAPTGSPVEARVYRIRE